MAEATVIASPWPTLGPYPEASLASWLEGCGLRHGDKLPFIDRQGRVCSFREAFTLALRIGRLLQEGMAKGDRVATK